MADNVERLIALLEQHRFKEYHGVLESDTTSLKIIGQLGKLRDERAIPILVRCLGCDSTNVPEVDTPLEPRGALVNIGGMKYIIQC